MRIALIVLLLGGCQSPMTAQEAIRQYELQVEAREAAQAARREIGTTRREIEI